MRAGKTKNKYELSQGESMESNLENEYTVSDNEATNTKENEQDIINSQKEPQSDQTEKSAENCDQINEQEKNIESSESDETKQYKKKCEEQHDRLVRLQADFENFKKRTEKERRNIAENAKYNLIGELLEVLDNFERALDSIEKDKNNKDLIDGFTLIYEQFFNILKIEGLSPMISIGETFDPYKHQAVMVEMTNESPEDTVVEEFKKGYEFGGKVLRHAVVKVAKPEGDVNE